MCLQNKVRKSKRLVDATLGCRPCVDRTELVRSLSGLFSFKARMHSKKGRVRVVVLEA